MGLSTIGDGVAIIKGIAAVRLSSTGRSLPLSRTSIILISGVCALIVGSFAKAQQTSQAMTGWFQQAQAEQGHQLFNNYCAQCHRPDLSGAQGPALKGSAFLNKWTDQPLSALYNFEHTKMPANAPDSLPDAKLLPITACWKRTARSGCTGENLAEALARCQCWKPLSRPARNPQVSATLNFIHTSYPAAISPSQRLRSRASTLSRPCKCSVRSAAPDGNGGGIGDDHDCIEPPAPPPAPTPSAPPRILRSVSLNNSGQVPDHYLKGPDPPWRDFVDENDIRTTQHRVRPVVRLVDGEDMGRAIDIIEAVLADLVRVRDQKRRRFDEMASQGGRKGAIPSPHYRSMPKLHRALQPRIV